MYLPGLAFTRCWYSVCAWAHRLSLDVSMIFWACSGEPCAGADGAALAGPVFAAAVPGKSVSKAPWPTASPACQTLDAASDTPPQRLDASLDTSLLTPSQRPIDAPPFGCA